MAIKRGWCLVFGLAWIPDGDAGAAGGVAALLQVEVKVNVLVFHQHFWHWLAGVVQLEMMMEVRCVWEDIDREQVAKIRGQLTNLWRNSVARFIVTRAATATASTERSPCGEGNNCVFVCLCLFVPVCLWICVFVTLRPLFWDDSPRQGTHGACSALQTRTACQRARHCEKRWL